MKKYLGICFFIFFYSCANSRVNFSSLHLSKSPTVLSSGYLIVYSSTSPHLTVSDYLFPERKINLSQKKIKQLQKQLRQINLSGLDSVYGRKNIRDVVTTSIRSLPANKSVTIYGHHSSPDELKPLLDQINLILK